MDYSTLSDLERSLIGALERIEAEKAAARIVPTYALFIRDIMPRYRGVAGREKLQKALNALTVKKAIKWGSTINDTYFKMVWKTESG